jgi:RNA polymerase sigma factor (sigma-70 family)
LKKKKIYTDSELVQGIIDEDNDVLLYLYETNFRSVKHYINSNRGNNQDADDIIQETVIILYKKFKENDFTLSCSVNTFFYAVAKNLWLKELEKKRRNNILHEDDSNIEGIQLSNDTIELIEKNEKLKLYRKHFEKLSEDCKKIIKLFLNNISIKEITKIMGYSSIQHTKNRRYRCKKSLIKKIKNCPQYKELGYETDKEDNTIPRW